MIKEFSNDLKIQKKWSKAIFQWCKKNLGESRYHDCYPKMITRNVRDDFYKGYYKNEKNLIYIYLKNNKTKIDLCETIIHEWKHYKQNVEGMWDRYTNVEPRDHPYEIQAEKYAKRHAEKCLKWVEKNIKHV